jgi:hypothetical protein
MCGATVHEEPGNGCTVNCVSGGAQKRTEQPFGWNRRPSSASVDLGELAIPCDQHIVDDAPDQLQRTLRGNAVFEVNIRKQVAAPPRILGLPFGKNTRIMFAQRSQPASSAP